jgi:pyruvate/2-oxoglutarate dehydrogenase complex dihydrolipoamide acyltransferase (E2) component
MMAQTVIMPMLGMAQETGVIVSWLKAHGDAVRAGEPLMEVETDKATMEVEAAHDGYLADLRYGPGDVVPVGEVVAMILTDRPDATEPSTAAASPAKLPIASPEPAPVSAPAAEQAPALAAPAPILNPVPVSKKPGRILASPKLRRLALEQGLDLGRLATAGHPEPYHVADLSRLAALHTAQPMAGINRVTATASHDNFASFHALLNSQTGEVQRSVLWSAFASGSLRATESADETSIVIRTETLSDAPATIYVDPDLTPFSNVTPSELGSAPTLIVRDLIDSPLDELALVADTQPGLCIAGSYRLTLTWPEGSLSTSAAIALIIGVARRIEQPLRHLL